MSRSKRPPTREEPLGRHALAAGSPTPRPLARQELLLVATLLALGIGLRFAFPSRMAVEHFDEGVYASNIWFGPAAGYQYPMRHLYAPPLLPSLIEWSMIFDQLRSPAQRLGGSLAAMLPSLVAGCATLLVVWRMTREWFGPAAGIASLALASLSDVHALYSRTALTEPLLLLLFVAAVWALRRSFATGSYLMLGGAGLFTGLAWCTKYNGWLPLAVGFGGLVVAFGFDRSCREKAARPLAIWLGTAALAFVVWSPCLRGLQNYGGYAAVAANHRQYVVGFGGWIDGLSRQYANLSHFDGWATCASVGAAVVIAGALGQRLRLRWLPILTVAIGLSAASVWLGAACVLFLLAVWFVATELCRRWLSRDRTADVDDWGLYFLAAWIAGLFVATPLYHPYPRLTLPWLCAVWIGASVAIVQLLDLASRPTSREVHRGWLIGLVFSSIALLLGLPRLAEHGWPAWQSRTGWLPVSKEIVAEVGRRAEAASGRPDEAIVVVYGEPGLFFQLNVDGTQFFGPAADLSFVDRPPAGDAIPTFLVTGPHAERTSGFQADLARHASRLRKVADYAYVPSDLFVLNQRDPRSLPPRSDATPAERVSLYEVVAGPKSR